MLCETLSLEIISSFKNENYAYHTSPAGQKPTAHELKVRSLSKSCISVNSGGFYWIANFKI